MESSDPETDGYTLSLPASYLLLCSIRSRMHSDRPWPVLRAALPPRPPMPSVRSRPPWRRAPVLAHRSSEHLLPKCSPGLPSQMAGTGRLVAAMSCRLLPTTGIGLPFARSRMRSRCSHFPPRLCSLHPDCRRDMAVSVPSSSVRSFCPSVLAWTDRDPLTFPLFRSPGGSSWLYFIRVVQWRLPPLVLALES